MSGAAGVTWAIAVVVALVVGVLVGRRSGARSAPPPAAGEPPSCDRPGSRAGLADRVLALSHHGVVVVDRDEFVILVNPAGRELGVVDGDRLVVPQLATLVRDVLATTRRAEDTVSLELSPVARREGVALSVVAVPIRLDTDPRPCAVALLVDDITESRRLEAVRRDFVANVSHELKTPVGALTLLAEAIQDAADEPDTVARFAGRMQREGARLGRLVRELIELSRLQGAEPLPGDARIALSVVIDDAVERNRLAADQAGVTLLVRCATDVTVAGNRAQLAMAVSNLLENAIGYSPAGTPVSVTVQAYVEQGRPMALLTVSDQGIGIAEADLDRVFERFYRVDPARSRATGGTGLGLAIVKHVASNHGGSVAVWSREGSGSTFSVLLPLAPSPAPVDQAAEPTGSGPVGGGPAGLVAFMRGDR